MIFLASVQSSEIDEIKDRFRAGGIPVFIVPDYSVKAGEIAGIGASLEHANGQTNWYSVSICLDDQFAEGQRLLDDANYHVIAPVDVEKFEATMNKLGANRDVEWFPEKNLTG